MDFAFMAMVAAALFPPLREILSSELGGTFFNLAAANASQEDIDVFLEEVGASNEAAAGILRDFVFPAIQSSQATGEEVQAFGRETFNPAAAQKRFREVFDPISQGLEDLPGQVAAGTQDVQDLFGVAREEFQTSATDVLSGFGDLREELRTGTAGITGGFEDVLGRARGLVSTLGEAERLDINRRFTEAGSELQMGLGARGLGGSTIASSLASGVERERSTALLGLQEQTARQRLGVEEAFALPGLSARERLLAGGINLGSAQLTAQERLAGTGANFATAQAGALQAGNQLFAGTSLGSLGARGNIAFGQVGAFDEAALQRINALLAGGGFAAGGTFQGAGLGLGFYGPNTVVAPGFNTPPNVFPYGGF